jgi:hypothetical protein
VCVPPTDRPTHHSICTRMQQQTRSGSRYANRRALVMQHAGRRRLMHSCSRRPFFGAPQVGHVQFDRLGHFILFASAPQTNLESCCKSFFSECAHQLFISCAEITTLVDVEEDCYCWYNRRGEKPALKIQICLQKFIF